MPYDATPLSSQVHARLRADILHARLRPGELLSENLLAQRLSVSRTPVRESFQRLAREGLVRVLPQRGSQVALLSMARIREALFVREAVESHVIRQLLSQTLDTSVLQPLDDCIARQTAAKACGDLQDLMQCDEDFHRGLLALCGMQGVWPIVAQARDMHQRVRAIALPELDTGTQAIADHHAILDTLRRNDAEAAVQKMSQHLLHNKRLTQQVATLHPDYFEQDEANE
jgi:GntR family transcriptional regulator, rspAB operon transcriptional repressor